VFETQSTEENTGTEEGQNGKLKTVHNMNLAIGAHLIVTGLLIMTAKSRL
jgi:hypothetical protein